MTLKINQQPDEELVIHYRASGDKMVVGELFKRHSLMCFAVCNKYFKNEEQAEDAAMNIFEKLFEDLKKHEVQNFKSWLHTVCRNYCLMQMRKQEMKINKNMVYLDDDTTFMELQNFSHQDINETDKEQKLITLENAIKELKDKQRECIELFYLQQKSYDEISQLTGYSNNDVKSSIQNGKRNLKILLSNKDLILWLTLIPWTSTLA
ncbi:MAG: RNA polymerase sigma factor [Bacteroidia bacterium]